MSSAVAERINDLFNGDMPDDSDWLALVIHNDLEKLPPPGSGSALERWRALAAVGQFDLSLTKLYEGAHRCAGDHGGTRKRHPAT